jgi:DNA-binding CsgD family transcriptional regulator
MAPEAGVVSGLLGRDRELEELDAFLHAALEAPRALLLEGEPGIGKTALWKVVAEAARERGFHVLTARPAEAEASLSFAALGDLLAGVADDIGALPDPQRRALRAALLLDEHEGVVTDSRALSVALLGLLHGLAEETPVLVAVDDVQWLDPPSAAALTFALRRVESKRVAFLGTARPGQRRLAIESLRRLCLGPLDSPAIDSIVRRALDAPLPRPALRRLGQASGGNPFYALELARGLLHEGTHLEPTDPVPLPASLGELLRSRLAALPPSSRRALEAVAALAQPTTQLVERAVGPDAEGLEAARDAGVIEADNGILRFTHPLLASAAYGEVDPRRRRELHQQLARVVPDREERARHLALAVEPPEAGVAAALEEAAEGAFARGATESAAELIEHALRFTPPASVDALHRRRLAAVGYLARTGAKARARAVLEEASSAARRGPDHARIALTATWFGVLDPSSCIEALREAVEDARDDPLLLLRVHCALVPMLLHSPDIEGAEHHAAIAVELAEELGDDAHLVLALVGVVHVALASGQGIDLERAEWAAALEAEAGNPYGDVGVAQYFLGTLRAAVGDLQAARRIFEAKAAEERRRADIGVASTLSSLAGVEIAAGNWGRAQALAEESFEVAREVEDVLVQAFAQRRLAALAVLRGEPRQAREAAAEGLRLADIAQSPLRRAEIVSELGLLELSLDDAATAASHFKEVARFVAETGFADPDLLSFEPNRIEVLIATGDLKGAEAATAAFESWATRLGTKGALASAARCRGQLEAARGDLSTSVETLAEARRLAADLGRPFELARTLLVKGTILRRARRIAEARETLNHASAMFDELGAALWAERARRELARLGGRPGQTRELTATEQQIAELVATGKSNHEVARTLHVSPKTVEWNLSKVYRKLRVSSRTELAAKLAKRSV